MKNQFVFQFDRTLQAAAHLLKKKGEMEYIYLLKLLYIADREYLAENGYTITGDRVVAMRHGTILSRVYDLIRGRCPLSDKWGRYIQTIGYDVRLIDDPGAGELSRLSMQKLDVVFERYGNMEPFRVVDLTHLFPEWQNADRPNTSTPIGWQEILLAQNRADMIKIAEEQIMLQRHAEKVREILNEVG